VADGPALRYFQKSDRILGVNGVEVNSVADLRAVLSQPGRRWLFIIDRKGRKIQLQLRG
jgi:S1-C subfamily serine protease